MTSAPSTTKEVAKPNTSSHSIFHATVHCQRVQTGEGAGQHKVYRRCGDVQIPLIRTQIRSLGRPNSFELVSRSDQGLGQCPGLLFHIVFTVVKIEPLL